MTRSTAVLVVLVGAPFAQADAGFFPTRYRYVPVRVTLEVRDLPANIAAFVVEGESVRRVAPGESLEYRRDQNSRGSMAILVYSVPTQVLEQFPLGQPEFRWLTREENRDCRRVGMIGLQGRVDAFDNRSVLESVYRLETTPNGLQLVHVSWNASVVQPPGVCCAFGITVPFVTIWLGVRFARRRNRHPPIAP